MFKSSNIPAAKPSSFTADQIFSDISAVMKQDSTDLNNTFTPKQTEGWYTKIQDFTNASNELIDNVELVANKHDELLKLRKDIENGAETIKQKAKEVLEC